MGLLWTFIHVHLIQNGPVSMLLVTLLITAYSFVIYAITHDTGFNVVLATLFHLMINVGNLLFLDVLNETLFMAINTAVWVTITAITVLARRSMFFTLPARTQPQLA